MIHRKTVIEILETTVRCHKPVMDRETLFLAWPYKIAAEADAQGLLEKNKENLLIDFIREKLLHRQAELAAARWYEAN